MKHKNNNSNKFESSVKKVFVSCSLLVDNPKQMCKRLAHKYQLLADHYSFKHQNGAKPGCEACSK